MLLFFCCCWCFCCCCWSKKHYCFCWCCCCCWCQKPSFEVWSKLGQLYNWDIVVIIVFVVVVDPRNICSKCGPNYVSNSWDFVGVLVVTVVDPSNLPLNLLKIGLVIAELFLLMLMIRMLIAMMLMMMLMSFMMMMMMLKIMLMIMLMVILILMMMLMMMMMGLSCAKLSSSWLQAYSASDQKMVQGANLMIWKIWWKLPYTLV